MSESGERLLYVLSAKGDMAWSAFRQTFDYFWINHVGTGYVDPDVLRRARNGTRRFLDRLGHCDFVFSSHTGRVHIAPPVLVRLPHAGMPRAILTGARSARTLQDVADASETVSSYVHTDVLKQGGELAIVPDRISVGAESTTELAAVANLLGLGFSEEPPAWRLSIFAASLDDYLAQREWTKGEPNWDRKDFDTSSLRFSFDRRPEQHVRLSKYQHPVRNVPVHLLWRHGSRTEIDPDWGRYTVLRDAGVDVLVYDSRQLLLAVPAGVPLPRLLSRALSLCSGYAELPAIQEGVLQPGIGTRNFDLFYGVPPQIAEVVASKVGQSLLRKPLKTQSLKEAPNG